jgi:hypothetical protein
MIKFPIEIIIDGIIYQSQTFGGVSRIFDNIIPRLCEIDDKLRVKLFISKDPVKLLTQHKHCLIIYLRKWDRYFRPWRFWKKKFPAIHNFLLQTTLGNTQGKIWFSTYYTTPNFKWNGSQVVLAYDFIHERYSSSMPFSEKHINRKKESLLQAYEINS